MGDPNVPIGEFAKVEHAPAPLLLLGMVIVPVVPSGTGVTVGDTPSWRPFGPTAAPGTIPSEEVALSGGVTVPTWANAGLPQNKDQAVTAIKNGLMGHCSDGSEGIAPRAATKIAVSPAVEATAFIFITVGKG